MNDEQKIKLLVVEDEPFLRDLLLMKFNSEGIEAHYTEDGEEAVKIAIEEHPDAILLDLVLPKMSGIEILEALKLNDATKMIPVIILSNNVQDDRAQQCKDKGAADILVKAHSSPSAIITKVKSIVGTKQS